MSFRISAFTVMAVLICATATSDAQQGEDAIARGIVVGQAYETGSVVVAGFFDEPQRSWPQSITLARLFTPGGQHPSADFVRALSGEHPRSFSGGADIDPSQDVFSGIDGFFGDRVALYRARVTIAESTGVVGWSAALGVREISYQNRGRLRPVSDRERDQIAAEKRKLPRDIQCTTEPQRLDAAKIALEAKIAVTNATIRLSSYQDPGCLGHLSTIYVLDVMSAGRPARRFEFRHYHGLL